MISQNDASWYISKSMQKKDSLMNINGKKKISKIMCWKDEIK